MSGQSTRTDSCATRLPISVFLPQEEKSRASEAVDKSAKMKDSLNEQGAQMRKLRGQLEESLKGGKDAMEVSEWKDMVSYLRKENDEKDVRVEKLSTLVKKLQAYLHELEEKVPRPPCPAPIY